MTYKVAIIGAGPVGTLCARLLSQADISVTVYESDVNPDFRFQGGSLDLHTHTGLKAIKEANLWEEFKKYARYDGQYLTIRDSKLVEHITMEASSAAYAAEERPEIDRGLLRQILIKSVPEGTIKWNYHLKRIDTNGVRRTLVFANGEEVSDFDYLVGAEGAWSKVRSVLSDVKPQYSGISYCTGLIPNGPKQVPEAVKLINRGACFVGEPSKQFNIMTSNTNAIHLMLCWREEDPEWFKPGHRDVNINDVESLKTYLLGITEGWDPLLRNSITAMTNQYVAKSLYELPVEFSWHHKKGVTIIGDSAHVMTPFAGEGVNVGFEDAFELSWAIIAGYKETKGKSQQQRQEAIDKRVEAHEKIMIPRMQKYMKLTKMMQLTRFYSGLESYASTVQWIVNIAWFKSPFLLKPFAAVGVRMYFRIRDSWRWCTSWFRKVNSVRVHIE